MKKGYKKFDSLLVVIYDDALVEHTSLSEILSCSSISANKAGRIWRIYSFNEERMRFIARIIAIKYEPAIACMNDPTVPIFKVITITVSRKLKYIKHFI